MSETDRYQVIVRRRGTQAPRVVSAGAWSDCLQSYELFKSHPWWDFGQLVRARGRKVVAEFGEARC